MDYKLEPNNNIKKATRKEKRRSKVVFWSGLLLVACWLVWFIFLFKTFY